MYYTYTVLQVFFFIGYIIFTIYIFASTWQKTWCETPDNWDKYSGDFNWKNVGDCMHTLNSIMIGVVIVWGLVFVIGNIISI